MASRLGSEASSEEADWAANFFQEITRFLDGKDIDVLEVVNRLNLKYPTVVNNSSVESIKAAAGLERLRLFREVMIARGVHPSAFVKAAKKNKPLYSMAKKQLGEHQYSSTEG